MRVLLAAVLSISAAVAFAQPSLKMMIPANPGGGWDQTGRNLAAAMQSAKLVSGVQFENKGGAAGTIGLAQFVNSAKGDPNAVMIGGMVMVGGIILNKSAVNLSQVTPIARLTSEWEVIVVPANSPHKNLDSLLKAFKDNPGKVSWGGGSAGGTDHILVGLIAKEVGVDPAQINYIAHSGGGEATAAILSGAVSAGVSGVSEFTDQVEAGAMRILAVSSEEPVEGVAAPTIKESGVNVSLMNWRAVFGPPELTAEQRDAVVAEIQEMHDSEEWKQALETNGWTDFFKTGDEFGTFLNDEIKRIEGVLRDIGLVE